MNAIDITPQKEAEEQAVNRYRQIAQLSDTVIEQAISLKHHNEELEERVRQRTIELHEANMDSIYMLAVASEAKDADTGAHVLRIQHFTQALARELGLPARQAEEFGYSAILHDVGKMSVPDQILKKPGPLDDPEWERMKLHTIAGERILSNRVFFQAARQIARSHHENWDGSGYPDGLRGTGIHLAARVVHVVDVYDALTNPRVYKSAWPHVEALAEIDRLSGKAFDPQIVDAFRSLAAGDGLDEVLARIGSQIRPND